MNTELKNRKIVGLIEENLIENKRDFCRKIDVSVQTLYNLRKGKKTSTLTIKKICNYFGVDWHDYV